MGQSVSTHLLPWIVWFCPVASEPVETYSTGPEGTNGVV